MTFLHYLLLAELVLLICAALVAEYWRRDRDEWRRTYLALSSTLGNPEPDSMHNGACLDGTRIRHWYKGDPTCRRCGHPNPVFVRNAKAAARVAAPEGEVAGL